MPSALRIVGKVLWTPVYLLWKAYGVLWWAFDDSDQRRAGGAAQFAPPGAPPAAPIAPDAIPSGVADPNTDAPHFPAQSAAFEVTDSSPRPSPAPVGALRFGFVMTLVVSGASGLYASGSEALTSRSAVFVWAWATVLAAVTSMYVVRHVARRQGVERPETAYEHTRVAVLGTKDAAVAAGKGVLGAGAAAASAARAGYRGARAVAGSRPVGLARRIAGATYRSIASLFGRKHATT